VCSMAVLRVGGRATTPEHLQGVAVPADPRLIVLDSDGPRSPAGATTAAMAGAAPPRRATS
jgi:hypothetical protein